MNSDVKSLGVSTKFVDRFSMHPEGRVLPDGGGWEYQYHLKDHLGNVRVTFTTKAQAPVNHSANLESGTGGSGEGAFGNYTSTTYDLVDHTDAGTAYQKVQWLNGGASGRVGLTKSLSVMPGDRVSVTAFAKYMNLSGTGNSNPFAAALTAAFGVTSGSTGEQLKLYNSLNDYGLSVAGGNHPLDDDTSPKAFVTILLFDRNFNLLDAAWDQINTTDGEQVSPTVKEPPHDELSKEVTVQEPGFAYIFLSNEHPTYVDVYFDDVTVGHTLSPIVSSADYFPFGLTFNSFQRENTTPQDYKYNSKEEQDELGLGWLDYGARMHMPDIGRWAAVDPLSEKYMFAAPYHFSGNNPILYIDDTGEDYSIYFEQDKNGNWSIRISATYYVKKGDEDSKKSAENAVKLWNNNSDYMLQTKDKEGNVSGEYAVSFDLKVMEVDDPDKEKQKDTEGKEDAMTKDGSSNIYSVVDDSEVKASYARGTTSGLYKIKVKRTDKDDAQAGPHEVGHTLGLPDRGTSSGSVMNGGNTGATSVQSWDVRDIIKFAETTTRRFPGNRKVSIHGSLPGGKIKPKK